MTRITPSYLTLCNVLQVHNIPQCNAIDMLVSLKP